MRPATLALCSIFLAGCALSITTPAAVHLTSGLILTGNATGSLSEGKFDVATADRMVRCSGNYDPLDTSPVITAPFTCTDGRTGAFRIVRAEDKMSGVGAVIFTGGEVGGRVGYGKNAAEVASEEDVPASGVAASGVAPDGCTSANTFGALSCETGAPKTHYVSGYTRANGTYVNGYVRSHK